MTSLDKVRGVGASLERALREHGIATAEDLAAKTPGDLALVPKIGSARAPALIASARALVAAG
ncbi:MAG: helix-hairpin-helix domain-containing protein, partial [Rhodobacteraceae bacterium]|nr:helix-hairpin-helix domain-containing protein [Paracoccaceae bacterium]